MAMRMLAGRLRYAGAAAAAASAGLSGAAYCDSKDVAPSFDPEALERGAAALREINKSPYAKKVGGFRLTEGCHSWCTTQLACMRQLLSATVI